MDIRRVILGVVCILCYSVSSFADGAVPLKIAGFVDESICDAFANESNGQAVWQYEELSGFDETGIAGLFVAGRVDYDLIALQTSKVDVLAGRCILVLL